MQAAGGGAQAGGLGGGVGGELAVGKIHEFEIELERLQSKVDHLKAQVSERFRVQFQVLVRSVSLSETVQFRAELL